MNEKERNKIFQQFAILLFTYGTTYYMVREGASRTKNSLQHSHG